MTIREAKRIRVGDWVCVNNPDGTCQQSQKVVGKETIGDSIILRLADGTEHCHTNVAVCRAV